MIDSLSLESCLTNLISSDNGRHPGPHLPVWNDGWPGNQDLPQWQPSRTDNGRSLHAVGADMLCACARHAQNIVSASPSVRLGRNRLGRLRIRRERPPPRWWSWSSVKLPVENDRGRPSRRRSDNIQCTLSDAVQLVLDKKK